MAGLVPHLIRSHFQLQISTLAQSVNDVRNPANLSSSVQGQDNAGFDQTLKDIQANLVDEKRTNTLLSKQVIHLTTSLAQKDELLLEQEKNETLVATMKTKVAEVDQLRTRNAELE